MNSSIWNEAMEKAADDTVDEYDGIARWFEVPSVSVGSFWQSKCASTHLVPL